MSDHENSTSTAASTAEVLIQSEALVPLPYTEPLSLRSLRKYFCLNADKMKQALGSLEAMELGGKYRIPVRLMPTSYWVDHGLLRPVSVLVPESSTKDSLPAR